jgi:hypothetical protein
MPIVKSALNGDSVGASATTNFEVPFSMPLGGAVDITTDDISGFSPLRMKGMTSLAIHIQFDAGTALNVTVTPQVAIRRTNTAALRFFDLNAGVLVGAGTSTLLEFTVPADYVRCRLVIGAGLTATGFIRIMCGA